MQKIYTGKTKDVYLQDDGNVMLHFKDAVTGADGKIDSGANQVIGEVAGKGHSSFSLTLYFLHLLNDAGITTHLIDVGPEPNTMIVRPARSFKLEVICRLKAWGSFVRRYGSYVRQGTALPSLVEFTLKDDALGDPLITEDALSALGIVSDEAIEHMKVTARRITSIIAEHLSQRNLELIDIKYEFGEFDGQTMLIDEVSGDSMRVVRDGQVMLQTELADALLGAGESR